MPITALLTAVAVASCGDPLRPLDVTLTIVSPAEGTSILAGDSVTLAAQVELASGHEAAALDVIWSAEEGVRGTGDGSWSAPDGRTLVRALAHDGTIRWTQNVPGAAYIIRFAALSDGTLYVAAGFYLHTLSRATGAVLRTLEFPAPIATSPAVGPDGIVYVVIGDGRLVAVQGQAGLDPNAPWPTWRRDNARTASVPRP